MENRSDKIKNRIPADVHAGEHFKDSDGIEYEVVYPNTPRRVQYKITSYRTMSVGAIHWYLTFYTDGCHLKVICTPKGCDNWREHKVGGTYRLSGLKEIPEGAEDIRLNVTRPVTPEEIKDPRYEDFNYEEGDFTEGFNTYEEARDRARSEFKRIFGEGWKLVANTSNRSYKHL
jgi:hypothetical protein